MREYFSRFCIDQPDVIVSVNRTVSEAADAAVKAFVAEHPDGASFNDLHRAAIYRQKLKCSEFVLQIHCIDQTVGYYGQVGHFAIINASSDNVFMRSLCWVSK